MAEINPQSRVEAILGSMAGTYSGELPKPQSRVEEYLLAIHDQGGGGGGTTNYNALTNKPKLNGVTIQGELTSEDVGISTEREAIYDEDKDMVIISQAALNTLAGEAIDYNSLTNKPTINGQTIEGDLKSEDIGLESDQTVTYDPESENVVISQDMLSSLLGH